MWALATEVCFSCLLLENGTFSSRWHAHQPRRITMSHEKLCPVHRGTIAMSGRIASHNNLRHIFAYPSTAETASESPAKTAQTTTTSATSRRSPQPAHTDRLAHTLEFFEMWLYRLP